MDSMLPQPEERRLIVLIPGCLMNNMDLAHQVHHIAARESRAVLYLAVNDDDVNQLTISRSLATMKAVTSGNHLPVSSVLADPATWLQTLREIYRPGDVIVCHKGQQVRAGRWKTAAIEDYLRDSLRANIYMFSGYYRPNRSTRSAWLGHVITWAGFLLLVGFFTWLEFQLDYAMPGIAGRLLLVIMLCVEIFAVLIWNRVTSS